MRQLVTFFMDRPGDASAEFTIGVRSVPYLADHGFQDMIVLPGSMYIEMALCVDCEVTKRVPALVRNVTFRNPVILSEEDTVIKVATREHGDGCVEYTFYDAGVDGSFRPAVEQYAARLEIDRNASTSRERRTYALSIEAFQKRSRAVITAQDFYKKLHENGNQYGHRFQNASAIWRAGDQVLGKIPSARQRARIEPHYLHPCLLDSITQLLAPFIMERGRTFVLREIEKLEIGDVAFPDTLWGHATLLSPGDGDDGGLIGNVTVFDEEGKAYLELFGVAFSLLDRIEAAGEKPGANLVIASNFTAEPLEDSLKFWGDHFGVPLHIEFAPYNQVFQQLLDTASAFRRNSDGVNIIVLALEEWAERDQRALMDFDKERAERSFGLRARYVLPNGLEIVHLNRYETDYVYKEIFEDQCYLRHGVRLRDGDTVVDIGANIGLFSLFVLTRCKEPKIYAFEPAPVVYDLLKANCDAYGSSARAFNVGVSNEPKTAAFTFYDRSSVFSGFHSDESEDREAIQAVVRNMLNVGAVGADSVEEYVNELTADRLSRRTYECGLTTVSDIIRDNRIERINLLKIDAEKSELDIIRGIADCDWPKIDQIVIEIHDRTRKTVMQVEDLLRERGYHCTVDQEVLLEHAGLFNIYATRGQIRDEIGGARNVVAGEGELAEAPWRANNLSRNVQDFSNALRSFMDQTSVPLILCFCPSTPAVHSNAVLSAALNDAEQTLLSEAGKVANVHTISSTTPLRCYSVNDYYDPHGHQVGHVPYTQECYAAIGTSLSRAIFNAKRSPFKVIVLDCDNTLWKGVCGEDGPSGVEVTAPYRALQEFMIGQMNAGMLLCLCSKNNEKDVLEVFERRADMLLKREHLVSWRINWNSKSQNIKSLADELDLGLDSFILIDDNPIECADARINCPGLLTLQLPSNAESIPAFLNHVWAFDHTGSTREDQRRTTMYQQGAQRQRFREQTLSLKDFVNGLQLRIEIAEATEDQFDRVSQLTFRTNQFNFTAIRRSAKEIKDFLKQEGAHCLAVHVVDRFGDYGLVGVVMYVAQADRYNVDTFLLSCRVLGRGVEHAIVSRLGERAVKEGKALVDLTFRPTERNSPALEFITSIGGAARNGDGISWTFPAESLAIVHYDPDGGVPITPAAPMTVNREAASPQSGWTFDTGDRSDRLQRIGEGLYDIDRLMRAIEEYRIGKRPLHPAAADAASDSVLEAALIKIWTKVLGRPRIGVTDNFFEVGGTSLRAVQVIAMIKKELKQTLSLVTLFECPTVTLLAAKMSATSEESNAGARTAAAVQRGQQRRYNTMKRRAS